MRKKNKQTREQRIDQVMRKLARRLKKASGAELAEAAKAPYLGHDPDPETQREFARQLAKALAKQK